MIELSFDVLFELRNIELCESVSDGMSCIYAMFHYLTYWYANYDERRVPVLNHSWYLETYRLVC